MTERSGSGLPEDIEDRRRFALLVVGNPTQDHLDYPHHDVRPEWIERTIAEPFEQAIDADGWHVYIGTAPEVGKWLRVVVEEGQLHTAYLDRRLLRRWGKP